MAAKAAGKHACNDDGLRHQSRRKAARESAELDIGESRFAEEHRFVAQNEKPDIAFCGGEVGQFGSLRGQRFAISIESGSLKPGAITDESNGACLSGGRRAGSR